MKYLFYLTKIINTLKLVLSKEYYLSVHPNKTDFLGIDDMYCKITDITYEIDSDYIAIRMIDDDSTIIFKDGKECDEYAIQVITDEINESRVYGWDYHDCDLVNIGYEWDGNKFIKSEEKNND